MDTVVDGLMQRFRHDKSLPEPMGDSRERDKLFELFVSYCVIREHCEGEFDPAEVRTGGQGDLEIDGAAVIVGGRLYTDPDILKDALASSDRVDAHFVVVQAKAEPVFKAATFAVLASNLKQVFDTGRPLKLNHNGEVSRFRQCIEAVYEASARFHPASPRLSVYYAAMGNPNQAALNPQRESAARELRTTMRFSEVEAAAVGADELESRYRRARDSVKVSFRLIKSAPLPPMPGVEQAHVGVLSAIELVDSVITDSRSHVRHSLFYDNVRGYLGARNAINAGINTTLQDDTKRGRFAVMNNGITIVTRKLRIVGEEFQLEDFHIVNGCQTCYSLFYARPALDPRTNLVIRVVETRDPEAIADIVEATNKQTHVAQSDFDARSQFHKGLESYFAAQAPPRTLLYERRPGQFGIGRLRDDSFPLSAWPGVSLYRDRIIDRSSLARAFVSAFLGQAWRASGQGAALERTSFNTTADPVPYYTAASLLFHVESRLHSSSIPGMFANAKYHLLAAAKCRLVGDVNMPGNKDSRAKMCQRILDVMWDSDNVGPFVDGLTEILLGARDAERPGGSSMFDSALVKSKTFGAHVRRLASEGWTKE